jgi:hypothetical protein
LAWHPDETAWKSIILGELLLESGEINAAIPYLLEGLRISRRKGDLSWGVARGLISLTHAGLKSDAPEQAASLLGAASALLKRFGVDHKEFQRICSHIEIDMRQRLGSGNFDHLEQDGHKAPIEH